MSTPENITDIEADDVTDNADLADVIEAIDELEADLDDEGPAPVAARAIGKTKKAPAAKAAPEGLTTRDVAERVGVEPSRLRVFLRSQGDRYSPPGSGSRYVFAAKDVAGIKAGFKKWEAQLAAEKTK